MEWYIPYSKRTGIFLHSPLFCAQYQLVYLCMGAVYKTWQECSCSIDSANCHVTSMAWASYQIRKIAGCACAGNAGNFSPAADFKGNRELAIPACTTACAWRTFRDACRGRLPAVTGKTFLVFPAYAHPQFCVSGKKPMVLQSKPECLFPPPMVKVISSPFFVGWLIRCCMPHMRSEGMVLWCYCLTRSFYSIDGVNMKHIRLWYIRFDFECSYLGGLSNFSYSVNN